MRRINNMIARCVVALVNPGAKLQAVQVRLTAGEVKSGMEHFEPYGFTANPHPGAEGVALFFGGDRSHGVVINIADRQYRLKGLKSGEVAIYTDEGDYVHFKRERRIEVKTLTLKVDAADAVEFATKAFSVSASERFSIDTKAFSVAASEAANFDTPTIQATGEIVSDGDQVAGDVSQINHPHDGVVQGLQQSGKPVPQGAE
ncbi:phage baseplate assembly protein V [Pseudomonas sp. NY15354]|uniref:phage baseplate assembly protein V n=1 Tax=Pseudomonas sp. NY15354 TaxID=3400351 RepID=UPI003A867136